MKRTIKTGIIQQTCIADVQENMRKSAANIEEMAGKGAQLVVFQELHNSLYFCQTENTGNFELAESIPGPSTVFYGNIARRHGIVLVASLFERRAVGHYEIEERRVGKECRSRWSPYH